MRMNRQANGTGPASRMRRKSQREERHVRLKTKMLDKTETGLKINLRL